MPTTIPPLDLAQRIQRLLDQRQQHVATLVEIEQTLHRISEALRPGATPMAALLDRIPADKIGGSPTSDSASRPKKRRGRRTHYATTAEDSVLAFVKANKPTTQQVKQHWASDGRRGSPDSTLSLLVKSGKLRRQHLNGQRGSRYFLAKSASGKAAAPRLKGTTPALLSGRDFVLQTVREQTNPTTAEIEASWKAARRPGRANKALGRLVDAGALKRQPLEDGRGSRYVLEKR